MAFSFTTMRLFRFNPGAASVLDDDLLEPVLIPHDIGGIGRLDGFTSWSENIGATVLRTNGIVLLRHGVATKTLPKGALKDAVRERVEDGAVPSSRLTKDVQEELLSGVMQSVSTCPILLDPTSGVAMLGCSSESQAQNAALQLNAVAADLHLKPVLAGGVAKRLCEWMDSTLPLPARMAFGRKTVLMNPEDKSETVYRNQSLPSDPVLDQMSKYGRIVSKLGMEFDHAMQLTIEDPWVLSWISPMDTLKQSLMDAALQPTERAQLDVEMKLWLGLLRPLIACMLSEFETLPYVAPAPADGTVKLPWVFEGIAA